MASTDKYCEDCRFFVRAINGATYSKCSAPGATQISEDRFVARELDVPPYCSTMRIKQCGPDAKWFESKSETAAA
jgi:hypothetical protein